MRDVLASSPSLGDLKQVLGLAAKEMQNQQPQPVPELITEEKVPSVKGGRFDFDDGGTYCGGWEDGKAHGHGLCTGPKGQGEYSGSWHYGFEVSGVYTWPSGSTFEGHWQNGKRHGLGVETRGRWIYRGEWTQGYKGRYGVRQSNTSNAKYEGTWASGLQDGYGSETYADGGTFQGQWLRGLRHGIGVRTSAPYGVASLYRNKNTRSSLTSLRSEHATEEAVAAAEIGRKQDDNRGGFVLKAKSDEPPVRRRSLAEKSTNLKKSILHGLRIKKQRSTGDIDKRGGGSIRSTGSGTSWASNESSQSGVTNNSRHTDSNVSFVSQDDMIDANVIETYMGEWKNDKRCGFGVSERSDGLKYQGEWYNNKKYGYGVTVFKDGTREEGKYKNNMLITSNKKKHIFIIRSAKFRERVDSAVNAAIRASQLALQKADIAISRTATARGKAEQADTAAIHAREDSSVARVSGKQFAPDFHQPGIDILRRRPDNSRSHLHPIPRSRGLRMSIDYGSNRDTPRGYSDHMPTVEDALLMQHSMANSKLVNFNYLGQSEYNEQMGIRVTANGGATHAMPSNDSLSLRGSIRRGRNLSIKDSRIGGGSNRGYSVQQAMNDHFDQYQIEPSHLKNSRSQSRMGSSTTFDSISAFNRALQSRPPSVDTCHPNDSLSNRLATDWTPDSGVSDGMDTDESPTRPGRRCTLPNLYNDESVASVLNNHNDVVSPDMKDWLSRQQLMMVVLFINISLAIMFFNLLT
ncbi:hypothetical protein CHUAL_013665 [Chamberlinius hualienensis]